MSCDHVATDADYGANPLHSFDKRSVRGVVKIRHSDDEPSNGSVSGVCYQLQSFGVLAGWTMVHDAKWSKMRHEPRL